MRFEYKVVPAPKKGRRARGIRGAEGRFANALMQLMNEHGADGWEYLRTDTLPSEERSGLTGKTTVFQNMLVFRRALEGSETELQPPAEVKAISEVHTPALPSPEEAQQLPANLAGIEKAPETRREVAAE